MVNSQPKFNFKVSMSTSEETIVKISEYSKILCQEASNIFCYEI